MLACPSPASLLMPERSLGGCATSASSRFPEKCSQSPKFISLISATSSRYGHDTPLPISRMIADLGNKMQICTQVRFCIVFVSELLSVFFCLLALQFSQHCSLFRAYMQKAGDSWDISPQIFLDFPQNFRLRTRNQYCTQAIA